MKSRSRPVTTSSLHQGGGGLLKQKCISQTGRAATALWSFQLFSSTRQSPICWLPFSSSLLIKIGKVEKIHILQTWQNLTNRTITFSRWYSVVWFSLYSYLFYHNSIADREKEKNLMGVFQNPNATVASQVFPLTVSSLLLISLHASNEKKNNTYYQVVKRRRHLLAYLSQSIAA